MHELRPDLGPALPHVSARVLRRLLRDQPLDGPLRAGRSPACGAQWDAFVATLREAGAEVVLLDPLPDLPDLVFTANLGLVDAGTFIPARMRHLQRRPEPAHAEAWFREHGFEIRSLGDDVVQEGAGDALPFEGTPSLATVRARRPPPTSISRGSSMGASCRSSLPTSASTTSTSSSARWTAAALLSPRRRWTPRARGSSASSSPIRSSSPTRRRQRSARTRSSWGARWSCRRCSPRLELELRERGFEPVVVDVSEFLKAGGGPRCLTLALDVELGRQDTAAVAERFTAHNYNPLGVTVTRAEGAWVVDDRGRRYLDVLSAYSALNFGHRHPKLVAAAHEQLDRVTLTSRAFHNDQLGPFARDLAALCGKDRVLPMNTGAEAVETAIKAARKWGYEVKGVRPDRGTIVVCSGNFHGRTTTIVSFSDDPLARDNVGPFTPGFRTIPFGDAGALAAALAQDKDVVAFLVEPVQGEAGVIVPPQGYLREARRLCSEHNVLLIADEIQSGLGRTGRTFACDHEGVVPDLYVLGKALGGGIVALSAVAGDDDVLGVFTPGSHGSTFGGNPLACAVGRAVLELLRDGVPQANAARLGAQLRAALDAAAPVALREVRSLGLWFGLDLHPARGSARAVCEALLAEGVLAKDTHEHTVRLAPPLTITAPEADWLLGRLLDVLERTELSVRLAPPPRPASFAA